jgi:siroheme synthase (precorrin-2 oxidase/ferrochelatase)
MEYFAKIEEPRKLRISLMTAAKESILAISSLEKIEDIRKRKSDMMAELKNDFSDTSLYCKALADLIADEKTRREILDSIKSIMAEADAEEKKALKAKALAAKQTAEVEKPVPAAEKKTEVDRLEYTLARIEQKLAELSK